MDYSHRRLKSDVRAFLAIVAALITIGLLFTYSASSVYALETFGSAHYYVKRQLMGIFLGFIGLMALRLIPFEKLKQFTPWAFLGSLGLTVLTLVPAFAQQVHGSSRWLNLFGIVLQPSEFLKMSLITYLGYVLSKRERAGGSFSRTYLPFLVILAVTCFILLKQPDFGLTVTLGTTVFLLLFIAHIQTKHLLITFGSCLPLLAGLIYLKPYRWQRITTFLNPWSDPQGAGFQIIQSLIAIGSGGWWGSGIAHSKQKFFYLPMQHTDFIFSIIAEETGFIGSSLIVILYLLLLYFGLRIAWQFKNMFSTYTMLGYVLLTNLQTIINLCVVTGLLPTKGLGLPFISYGNTALIANLCMVGFILNMVHEDR